MAANHIYRTSQTHQKGCNTNLLATGQLSDWMAVLGRHGPGMFCKFQILILRLLVLIVKVISSNFSSGPMPAGLLHLLHLWETVRNQQKN